MLLSSIRMTLDIVAMQVVGISGHNPSGHCLIASQIIDYVAFAVTSNQRPSKRPASDHNHQFTIPSKDMMELSLVCDLDAALWNEDESVFLFFCAATLIVCGFVT